MCSNRCLVILGVLLAIPSLGAPQTIDTFALSDLQPAPDRFSQPVVGANGDLWFTVNKPERLIRIHDSRMECVFDSGHSPGHKRDVSVSPEGRLYLSNCRYVYSPEQGIMLSGVIQPPFDYYANPRVPGIFDADMRMYCTKQTDYISRTGYLWEMLIGQEAILRYTTRDIGLPLIVSLNECWMSYAPYLIKVDLESGSESRYRMEVWSYRVCAKDCMGRLWISLEDIVIFNGEEFETFAPVIYGPSFQWYQWYDYLALSGDLTVWAITGFQLYGSSNRIGITRFKDGEALLLSAEDGLLSGSSIYRPLIDYDGNVWVVHGFPSGLSRIADGGWPPMRLMLHRLETPESIAVEAQVINNGPVVGVDAYVACELNGQLLYWPNWQPAPCPVQVNLRPGHNQTATIISVPRATIPPGTYTFYACMTGRGTQKLIGPLDRKFESLTVEVD